MRCPQCQKELAENCAACPRCQADLSLLADVQTEFNREQQMAEEAVRQGDLGKAVKSYLRILEVDPSNLVARQRLSWLPDALRLTHVAMPRRRRRRQSAVLVALGVIIFAACWLIIQNRPTPTHPTVKHNGNTIFNFKVYRAEGAWVYDDASLGVMHEPFVGNMGSVFETAIAKLPPTALGYSLAVSPKPFPGADIELERTREESSGQWYRRMETQQEGWLSPAFLKRFESPPPRLYIQINNIGS